MKDRGKKLKKLLVNLAPYHCMPVSLFKHRRKSAIIAKDRPFVSSDLRSVFTTLKAQNEHEFLLITRTLLCIIDLIDHYTYSHSIRVTRYCDLISGALQMPAQDSKILHVGALLHDVGKIAIGKEILCKADRLNDHEWELVKEHPVLGAQMLQQAGYFDQAVPIVRHHHERFDGQGYPDGLGGEEIPFAARILAITDSFDAMTTDRPYSPRLTCQQAIEELWHCTPEQFDPAFVQIFTSRLQEEQVDKKRARYKPDPSVSFCP